MAQYIKNANIFGRIGSGVGQGLAEQLPKEIERNRLKSGLQELSNKKDLTPFQQFAELTSIPGITPQAIQTGGELLKQQGVRNAYSNKAKQATRDQYVEEKSPSQSIRDIQFGNQQNQRTIPQGTQINPRQEEQETINESGQPQIVETNPLRPEAQPRLPWTPERRDQEIGKILDDQPNLTFPEAVNIAADNEKRELSIPGAVQAQDEYTEQVRNKVRTEFERQIKQKLQKTTTPDVYQDITGENLSRMERIIEKDLKVNPKANVSDVVNKRTNELLDLAKNKNIVRKLSNKPIYEKIIHGEQTRKSLEQASKIYRDTGNSNEFWNTLQSDFNMSPQGASVLAYPPNKNIKSYIEKVTPSNISNFRQNAAKRAIEIEDKLTQNDSLLAIANAFKQKDPMFDQTAFFDQLKQDQEELRLSPQQERELLEREGEAFPNWGDLAILPIFRSIK